MKKRIPPFFTLFTSLAIFAFISACVIPPDELDLTRQPHERPPSPTAKSGPTSLPPSENPYPSPSAEPPGGNVTPEGQTPYPAPSQPVSEPYPGPAPEIPVGAAILYRRSGGLAGISKEWVIYPNGRIVSQEKKEWQVTEAKVTELLTKLETLGFFELKGKFVPVDQCCDRFLYTLFAQRNEKSNTITVLEAVSDAPQSVWDALATVSQFIDENTK
jgi:hypothetical protein